jgi:adenylate cyclase
MAFSAKPTLKTYLTTVGLTSLLLGGAVVSLRQLGLFESAELQRYDHMVRSRTKQQTDPRVVVVAVSETDIQTRQEYPLKDDTMAELLQKLSGYEPRAIGVDIGRDVPQGTLKGRQQMVKAVRNNDRIIMACLFSGAKNPSIAAPTETPQDQIAFADFPQDPDSTVRRVNLISAPPEENLKFGKQHVCNDSRAEVPSLAFSLAMTYLADLKIEPVVSRDEIRLGNGTLKRIANNIGGYANADAPDFQVLLNYRANRDAVQTVEMGDVLAGKVDPEVIKDKLVLIGYTSQVVRDTLKTPYAESAPGMREMYGVQVHAQVASQLLSTALDGQRAIESWSEPVEIAYILLWSFVGGTIAFYARKLLPLMLLGGGSFAACWGIAYGLFMQGLWVPLVPANYALFAGLLIVGMVDRINRSGYAQAFYQQFTMQMSGQMLAARDSREDYLAALVRRARSIRAKRDGVELQEDRALAINQDLLNMKFDTPEAQALYERMKQQWESENRASLLNLRQQQQPSRDQQVTQLLDRARTVRTGFSQASPGFSQAPRSRSMELKSATHPPESEEPIIHPDWPSEFEKSDTEVHA